MNKLSKNTQVPQCDKTAVMQSVISPNELRLGNIVSSGFMNPTPSGLQKWFNPCEVKAIGIEKIIVNEKIGKKGLEKHDYSNIRAITITEYWLLKFGFEKVKGSDCDFKLQIQKDLGGGNPEFDIWVDLGEEDGDGRLPMSIQIVSQDSEWLRTDIKAVHQLQNLYFSLTAIELTVA